MRSDILRSLDLAQQFGRAAADATGGDFDDLDLAIRIDNEGAAISKANSFDHDVEVAGELAGRVAEHGIVDLADGGRCVVPSLVAEMRVGRDRVDFNAELLESGIVVGEVFELRRADEGEVGWIEEENGPLALEVGVGDVEELASLVSGGLEGLDLGVNQRHELASPIGWAGQTPGKPNVLPGRLPSP